MASPPTLDDLVNLTNETSVVNTINNNNALIEAAIQDLLSRTGTTPNTMEADLDMNSNRILNLPTPVNDREAATKDYVEAVLAALTSVPASIGGEQISAQANGITGGVGNDMSTLINDTLSLMDPGDCLILDEATVYEFDSVINIPSNTCLKIGKGSTLRPTSAIQYPIRIADAATNVTICGPGTYDVNNNNSAAGGRAIFGRGVKNVTIKDLEIINVDRGGINLISNLSTGDFCQNILIENNYIHTFGNNLDNPVIISGVTGGYECFNVTLRNNRIIGDGQGAHTGSNGFTGDHIVVQYTDGVFVYDNHIDLSGENGMSIARGCKNVIIHNNLVERSDGHGIDVGSGLLIIEVADATNFTVSANQVTDGTTGAFGTSVGGKNGNFLWVEAVNLSSGDFGIGNTLTQAVTGASSSIVSVRMNVENALVANNISVDNGIDTLTGGVFGGIYCQLSDNVVVVGNVTGNTRNNAWQDYGVINASSRVGVSANSDDGGRYGQANVVDLYQLTGGTATWLFNDTTAIASVAGSDKQIQFNNSGAFGGASNLYWDESTDRLGYKTSTPQAQIDLVITTASGQTAPAGGLLIDNSTNTALMFLSGNTSASTIFFGDTDNNAIGRIVYDHNVDTMDFRVNTSSRLTISSAGVITVASGGIVSVPLGAVGAPSYTFTGDTNTGIYSSAADTLNFTTGGTSRLSIDSAGLISVTNLLRLPNGSAAAPSLSFSGATTSGLFTTGSGVVGFAISGAEKARMDSTGFGVGITPSTGIHLGGTASQTLRIESTTASTGQALLELKNTTSTWQIRSNRTGNDELEFFLSGSGQGLIMNTSRNMGIGTASPSVRLHVGGAGAAIRIGAGAFASLAAASTAGSGALAVISDSTVTTKGSTIAGGGANLVLGMSNGTNWIVV